MRDASLPPGARIYRRATLPLYDAVVYGLNAPFAWRCPRGVLQRHLEANVTANHLDVGVGTGTLLARCRFPAGRARIGLLDVQPASLAAAARRLARHRPEVHLGDVSRPLSRGPRPYASVSLGFLLHCLPGPTAAKGTVLDHLRPWLEPAARVSGSTVLGRGVAANGFARALLAVFNARGVFDNREDDLEGIAAMLAARLDDLSVRRVGMVALFAGRLRP